MPDPKNQTVDPDAVAHVARVAGVRLPAEDQRPVGELLGSLLVEMERMRAMEVGESEPAPIYRANP